LKRLKVKANQFNEGLSIAYEEINERLEKL
jgi:hypothetical protein